MLKSSVIMWWMCVFFCAVFDYQQQQVGLAPIATPTSAPRTNTTQVSLPL